MNKISAYVLTKNSDRHLEKVLQPLCQVADEIVVVDSGSQDRTAHIAKSYAARFIYHEFDNFVTQRNFAADQCRHDWILFVDADEILSERAVHSILALKAQGFTEEAYVIARHWIVLGKSITSLYPIVSPDYPIRLFNKKVTWFQENSTIVHETPTGHTTVGCLQGDIHHYTFETPTEILRKLQVYTDLAARDLILRQRAVNYVKYTLSPIGAWIKFYLFKGGYRDGWVGLVLGKYAYNYVRYKYQKALGLKKRLVQ